MSFVGLKYIVSKVGCSRVIFHQRQTTWITSGSAAKSATSCLLAWLLILIFAAGR